MGDVVVELKKGIVPARPQPDRPKTPTEALDATLMRNLVRKLGLTGTEIEKLSKEEAVAKWNDYLAGGGR